jgi:hypothetical protein
MPGQHDFRFRPGKARGENRWPNVPSMVAMDDLRFFTPDEPCGAQDELKLVRSGTGIEKWRASLRKAGRKRAPGGTCDDDLLAEAMQLGRQFDALIVGAATGEEGIQMHDAHLLRGRAHAHGASARYCSTPRSQRIFFDRIVSAKRCWLAET